MNLRAAGLILSALAVLALSPPLLAASEDEVVLGRDSSVLRLLNGLYGELFPGETATDPSHPVLALEILHGDGSIERQLVPGTESRDLEAAEILLYEQTTQVAYLFWEGLRNGIHPLIYLTSFDGASWAEVSEITSSPFSRKGLLEPEITRDSVADRTIVHLTWWEEAPYLSRKLYAPIVIEDGAYLGWAPVFDLDAFADDVDGLLLPVPAGIEHALRIQPGKKANTVVMGFLSPEQGQLVTLEVEVLPAALGTLADKIRAQIIAIGNHYTAPAPLADEIQQSVLTLAPEFHVASRTHMASEVRAEIVRTLTELTQPSIDLLADKIRAQIIAIGARIDNGGLETLGESQILEIGRAPEGGGPYHLLKVTHRSSRPAPSGLGNQVTVYLSGTGNHVLLAWNTATEVHYLESEGSGWSSKQVIGLSDGIDHATIHRMLEQRTLSR